VGVALLDGGGALVGWLVEDFEEQVVQRVKVGDEGRGEEAKRLGEGGRVAGVVAAQLALQQLEKQDAVDPSEAQLQGHAKKLGLVGSAVGVALGGRQLGQSVFAFEHVDGVA
jgi:hypothetical protein